MSDTNPANPGPARPLPRPANLEHLRKEAKQRLKAMRLGNPGATLAAAQLTVAREYGFTSWRRLVAYVKAQRDKEAQLRDQLRAANAFEQGPQAFRDGFEAEEKSDYKTAAAYYRQAIAESPTFIPAYYRLGRALVRQQLYSEALDAFEGLLKVDPENLLAHYEIGKLSLCARNYPDELLFEFDHENLLANYKVGKLYLSAQNYADAIAKYRWLKAQTDNPMNNMADPSYELLPNKPRTGNLAQHPKHQAYAAELAQYLLDLIPPEVAEQNQFPAPQIDFAVPRRNTPKDLKIFHVRLLDPKRAFQILWKQPVALVSKPFRIKPMHAGLKPTILYREKAKYTEIARVNRLQGEVILSVVFDVTGQITDIRVVRGLPDGLTQRAIHATQQIRFEPATEDGTPVSVRGKIEFTFNLH